MCPFSEWQGLGCMNLPKQTLLDIPWYPISFLVGTDGRNATQDATLFIAVLRFELCYDCLTSPNKETVELF